VSRAFAGVGAVPFAPLYCSHQKPIVVSNGPVTLERLTLFQSTWNFQISTAFRKFQTEAK
jgi:hypothetical protein